MNIYRILRWGHDEASESARLDVFIQRLIRSRGHDVQHGTQNSFKTAILATTALAALHRTRADVPVGIAPAAISSPAGAHG